MIHRVYYVTMPSTAVDLDIILRGPVGTPAAPVAGSAYGGTRTLPPAGWNAAATTGTFFEWRSRPLRFETVFGAAGFVPRARLGYLLGVRFAAGAPLAIVPDIVVSQSLVGALPSPYDTAAIPDPAYGPVLRFLDDVAVRSKTFVVTLSIMEPKDEDRDPI